MLEVRKEKEEKKGQEKRSGSISHSPKDYNLIRRTWRNKRHDDNNSHYVIECLLCVRHDYEPFGHHLIFSTIS